MVFSFGLMLGKFPFQIIIYILRDENLKTIGKSWIVTIKVVFSLFFHLPYLFLFLYNIKSCFRTEEKQKLN